MRMPETETLAEASPAAPPDRLFRVEAYDISNTNGIDTVAAMVVFRGLKPDRRAYRKFKIRTDMPGDDYAAMQEVLYRRFKRAMAGDPGFKELPDLLVIDGGKGHLHAARQILAALQLEIPAVGAVKDDHHRTRGLVYVPQRAVGKTAADPLADTKEIDLRQEPFLFSYIGTMQEEVHRFVIEYHRKIRDNKSLVSILDEIPGIGPKKRTALLRQFGSVEAVKAASKEELMETPGITAANATAVINFFAGRES
jgi:excinuclease ABC subunit C